MEVKELNDDALLNEMIYWVRVGRNEGELQGEDHKTFQTICKEIAERKLLRYPSKSPYVSSSK